MDFQNAALLSLLVFTGVELIKKLWTAVPESALVPLALVLGVGATFLAGGTVWAHTEVVGGHALDTLNASSKIVAGLLLGAGAVGFNVVQAAVRNVGANQEK